MEKYGLSLWDANILSAASMSNCSIIYSEDLQNSQTIDGVKVVKSV